MCVRAFIAVFFLILSFVCTEYAYADNYSEVTTDQKIIDTLNVLKSHKGFNQDLTKNTLNIILGDNLTQKPLKIMFYDLSSMGSNFEDMDAVACKKKNSDRLYILINKIHQDAPAEALASLLTHEVIHQDDISSIEEEITGWTNEAKAWMSFKSNEKNLDAKDCLLVKRLNNIEKMYAGANYKETYIAQKITSISGYAALPQYSPGFGI